MKNNIEAMLMRLPFASSWVSYKGEIFYGVINYERTKTAKRPMIDLHYCATAALCNTLLIKTVSYDKNKFEVQE